MQSSNQLTDPLVYVIMVNWNGMAHLDECLRSVQDLEYSNFKILLVDNASQDESVDLVRRSFPEVKIIANERNVGFAEGNNIGIRHALDNGAAYVALLNTDTRVDPAWLRELVKAAERNTHVGAVASKMLFYYSPSTINSAGSCMTFSGWGYDRGIRQRDQGQFDEETETFGACAGAMLLTRAAVEKAGLFDPRLFMVYEDVDLSWRLLLCGFRIVYTPKAIVYHKLGGSLDASSVERTYFSERNRLRNVIKNYQWWNAIVTLYRGFFIDLMLLGRLFDEEERWRKRARACLRAYLWNVPYLPDTLVRRWIVQRRRVRSDRDLLAKFDKIYGYPGGDDVIPGITLWTKHKVKTLYPNATRALRSILPKRTKATR